MIEDKHEDRKESRESKTRMLNVGYVFALYSLLIRRAESLPTRSLTPTKLKRCNARARGIIAK